MKIVRILSNYFLLILLLAGAVYGSEAYTEYTDLQFDAGTYSSTYRLGTSSDAKVGLEYYGRTDGLNTPNSVTWYSSSWRYRKEITINSSNVAPLTNYSIPLEFDTQSLISLGHMNSDGSDIRFTYSTTTAIIDHCIESGINTASTKIWVEVPSILASSSATIYMYYGNTSAIDKNDMNAAFVFGDGFNAADGSSPSTSTWVNIQSGLPIGGSLRDIQSKQLRIRYGSPGGIRYYGIRSLNQYSFSSPRRFHFKVEAKSVGPESFSYINLCESVVPYSEESQNWLRLIIAHNTTAPQISLKKNVAGIQTDLVVSSNTAYGFHDVEFLMDTANIKVLLDGVEIYSGSNNLTFNNPFIYIEIASAYSLTDDYFFDNVFVSKFSLPEPSVSGIATGQGRYYSSGTYLSKVIDTGAVGSKFYQADWAYQEPLYTDIDVYVRASDTDVASATFNEVFRLGDPGVTGRYAQYRLNLSNFNVRYTPYVSSITLCYVSPPKMLNNIDCDLLSVSSIKWYWQDISSGQYQEEGFRIYDENHILLNPFLEETTFWIETGLIANTPYSRYVQSYNLAGSSSSAVITKYTFPRSPSVTCDKNTLDWYSQNTLFTFTNQRNFGYNGVEYYRYVWIADPTYTSWTDTEPQWSSGTLQIVSSPGEYYLHVRSYNGDDVFNGVAVYGPYRLDIDMPVVTGFNPSSMTWNTSGVSVAGELSDTGGSNLSQYRYRWTLTDERPLVGWSLWDNSILSLSSSMFNLSYSVEGLWYLHVEVEDVAGNTGYASSGTYGIDSSSPIGTINIDNGSDFTYQKNTTLFLSYNDVVSGVKEVRYRNVPDTWTVFEAPQVTRSWLLAAGDGLKTVEYEIRDNAGNYKIFSDTITLDSKTVLTGETVSVKANGILGEPEEIFSALATLSWFASGEPISGKNINFIFQGSTVTAVTNVFGIAVSTYSVPNSSGTYLYGLQFEGDGSYTASSGTGTVVVNPRPTILITQDINTSANFEITAQARLKDSTGIDIPGNLITFVFEGSTKTAVTNSIGIATVTYTAPSSTGVYTYTSGFAGDAVYSLRNASGKVAVGLRLSILQVNNVSTVIGSTFTVQASLMDGVLPISTRTVSFVFEGSTKTAVTNELGIATVTFVAPLSTGTFQCVSFFAGDESYGDSNDAADIFVGAKPVNLETGVDSPLYIQSDFDTWVRLVDTIYSLPVSGKPVSFVFEGSSQTVVTNSDGISTATFNTGSLPRSTSCYYYFNGDGEYSSNISTLTFTINKRPVALYANDLTTIVMSTFTASISLKDTIINSGISGEVISFDFLGSTKSAVTNALGIATVTYQSNISTGTYNFTATFEATGSYLASNDTATVTVNLRPASLISQTRWIYVLDSFQTIADLKDSNTNGPLEGKTVTFNFNGVTQSTTTNASGRAYAVYSGTPIAGTYSYYADFSGDSVFSAYSSTANIIVYKRPANLVALPVNVQGGNVFEARGELKDGIDSYGVSGKTINFVFQSTPSFSVTDGLGVAKSTYTAPISTGTYYYSASFSEDQTYLAASATGTVNVQRREALLTAYPKIVSTLSSIYFSAAFTDGGSPLADKTLNFQFLGSTISAVTNGSGMAVGGPYSAINSSGSYVYSVTFDGDADYAALVSSSTLIVEERSTYINIFDVEAVANSTFTLRADLYDGEISMPVESKILSFNFQGSTTTETGITNSAGTVLSIFLAPSTTNTYTYSATFNSDGTYAGSSSTGNVTVKLRPTTLQVSDISTIANNSFTANAQLYDFTQGYSISDKPVTFIFLGSTITVVSDGTGIASAIFTAPSSSGTYSISINFDGDTLYDKSNAVRNVIVGNRNTLLITYDIPSAIAQNPFTLTARLRDGFSGLNVEGETIRFTFSGSTETKTNVTDALGYARVTYTAPDAPGSYTYSGTHDATPLYGDSTSTSLVTVNKRPVTLTTNDLTSIIAGSQFLETVVIRDAGTGVTLSTKTINFNFQSVDKTGVSDGVGIATMSFTAPATTGTYVFTATFDGDFLYASSAKTSNVGVVERPSIIEITNVPDAVVGLPFTAQALLKDFATLQVISSQTITLTFSTSSVNSVTNAVGVASAAFVAPSTTGTYVYSASYAGNGYYSQSQSTGSVTVKLRPVTLSLTNTEILAMDIFTANATIKDTITNEVLAGKSISFVFEGTTKTVVTDDLGVAVSSFTAPVSSGTYSYYGYIYSDSTYESSSGQASVKVNRRPIVFIPSEGSYFDWAATLSTVYPRLQIKDGNTSDPVPNLALSFVFQGSTNTGNTDVNGWRQANFPSIPIDGWYPCSAYFSGNATYLPNSMDLTNGVWIDPRWTATTVYPVATTANTVFSASAKLIDGEAGGTGVPGKNVTFTFQGSSKTVVTDGGGVAVTSFTAPGSVGDYQIKAQFFYDRTYNGSSSTDAVTVGLRGTTMIPVPDVLTVGSGISFQAQAKLIDSATGVGVVSQSIKFIFEGSTVISTTNVFGIASASFMSPIIIDTYTFTAVFEGDLAYQVSSTSGTIVVEKNITVLTGVSVPSVPAGNDFYAIAALTLQSNGVGVEGKTINFVFEGTSTIAGSAVTDILGIASTTYAAPLTTGTYNFTASFDEDGQYKASSDTMNVVNVVRRVTSLNSQSVNVFIGDNFIADALLTDNDAGGAGVANKNIVFILHGLTDSTTSASTYSSGEIGKTTTTFLSPASSGTYTYSSTFEGDSVYDFSSDTRTVSVSRRITTVAAENTSAPAGSEFIVTATLYDNTPTLGSQIPLSSETVKFVFGSSVAYATTNELGVATATFTASSVAGSYGYSALFEGTTTYNLSSDNTKAVTVTLRPTVITSDGLFTSAGANFSVDAVLIDFATSAKLSGMSIKFVFQSTSAIVKTAVTDGLGKATVNFTAPVTTGTYNFTSAFMGDFTYQSSTDSVNSVIITAGSTTLVGYDRVVTVNKVFTASATLTSSVNSIGIGGKNINFVYGGNTVLGPHITDQNGVATCDITPLSTGTYVLDISFDGDSSYYSSSDTNTITVNQRAANILQSDIQTKVSMVFIATATLRDTTDGITPIPGEIVTFLFDGGAPQSVTTNSLGVATVTYTAPVSSGVYTINSTFDGNLIYSWASATNTVSVSKHNTSLAVTNLSVTALEIFTATATFRNLTDNAVIQGKNITFVYKGASSDVVTDVSGRAVVQFSAGASSGPWRLDASFDGEWDPTYISSDSSSTVTVLRRDCYMVAEDASAEVMKVFTSTATLYDTSTTTTIAGASPARFVFEASTITAAPTNAQGKANADFTAPVSSGIYRMNVYFSGNETYNPSSISTSSITVTRQGSKVSVGDFSTLVYSVFNASAVLVSSYDSSPISGKSLRFVYSGSTCTAVTNVFGIAIATFSAGSSPGTFRIDTAFDGDFSYSPSSVASGTISVGMRSTDLLPTSVSGVVGKVFVATATLKDVESLPVAGRTLRFVFSGSTVTAVTDGFGMANAAFTASVSSGTYYVGAYFDGDTQYYSSTTTIPVIITARPTNIVPLDISVLAMDIFTTTVTLMDVDSLVVSTKTIKFVFQGSTSTQVTDDFGIAYATFTAPINSGTYYIDSSFSGDEDYLPSTASITVNTLKRPTTIAMDYFSVKVMDVFTATAALKDLTTFGIVSGRQVDFSFSWSTSSLSGYTNGLGIATATYSAPVASGTYQITATFAGDFTYDVSSVTNSFIVTRRDSKVTGQDISCLVLDVFITSATFFDAISSNAVSGKDIVFNFEGVSSTVTTNGDGIAAQSYTAPSASGTYNMETYFTGDQTYNPSTVYISTVTINRRNSVISVNPEFTIINDTFSVTATLWDGVSSSTVPSKTVLFLFQNSTYTAVTDSQGVARGTYFADVSSGTYEIKASFEGDATYNISSATETVTVLRRGSAIDVDYVSTIINEIFTASATIRDLNTQQLLSGCTLTFSFNGSEKSAVANGSGLAVTTYTASVPFGAHQLTARFDGDVIHSTSSASNTVDVSKRPLAISIESVIVKALNVFSATATLTDVMNSQPLDGFPIIFEFELGVSTDTETGTTGAGGLAFSTFTAPGSIGQYLLRASFTENSTYYSCSSTETVNVINRETILSMNDIISMIDEVFIATATLTDTETLLPVSTRTVSIVFVSTLTGTTDLLGNATAAFTSPSLSGSYIMSSSFSSDTTYLASDATGTLTVVRRPSAIYSESVNAIIDEIFVATATLVDGLDFSAVSGRSVFFVFEGSTFTATTDASGIAVSTFTAPVSSGPYVIDIVFDGDARFLPFVSSETITVYRRPSLILFQDTSPYAMEVFTATATLVDGLDFSAVSGRPVYFVFEGSTFTATTDASGIAVSTFTAPVSSGPYVIDIAFSGDSRFVPTQSTGTITVVNRPVNTVVRDVTVNAMDVFNTTATLVDALNSAAIPGRKVSFLFEGTSSTDTTDAESNVNAVFTAPSSSGTYLYSATFSGDATYDFSSGTGTVTVLQRASNILMDNITISAYENYVVTATLVDSVSSNTVSGKIIRFEVEGSTVVLNAISNGVGIATAVFTASSLAGDYQLTATFEEDDSYFGAVSTGVLTVIKRATNMNMDDTSAAAMDVFSTTVTLRDTLSNQPIPAMDVVFLFEGYSSTVTTDSNGIAISSFDAPEASGTYVCTVIFNGNGTYEVSTATSQVQIYRRPTNIVARDTTASSGEQAILSVTLLDSSKSEDKYIANREIEFTFNAEVKTGVTNSVGIATVSYTAPSTPMTYAYTVRFLGDYTFLPSTAAAKVRVGILTSLILYDVETYAMSDINAKAKLIDYLSNNLENKSVNFDFTGSTGSVKTDASGIAEYTFTAPPVSGTYIYTANFAGDDIYTESNGTATVKVNQRITTMLPYNMSTLTNSTFTITVLLQDTIGFGGGPVGMAGQDVNIFFNGSTSTVTTDGGGYAEADFFASLSSGTYNYTAAFQGSSIYTASNTTGTVTVGLRPTILVSNSNFGAISGSTFTITSELRDINNNTGISGRLINFDFNSSTGTAFTDSSGLAEYVFVAPISSGSYSFSLDFNGDNEYMLTSDTGTVTLGQRPTMVILANISVKSGSMFVAEGKLWDIGLQQGIAGKNISFMFQGSTLTAVTDAFGISSTSFLAPSSTGTYEYSASYDEENLTYMASYSSSTVTVAQEITSLVAVDPVSIRIYEPMNVGAVLKNSINLQLENMPVKFTFEGVDIIDNTDDVGTATGTYTTLGLLTSTGTYNYSAIFEGDTIYIAGMDTSNVVNVSRRETALETLNVNTIPNKAFTAEATLKDNVNGSALSGDPVSGKSIIFDFFDGISTVTLSAVTSAQGVSTTTFTAPASTGTYFFSARFEDGDPIYKASSSTSTVYVLIDDGSGFISTSIEVENTSAYVNSVFTASATMISSELSVPSKTILFEYFNGISTYTRLGITDIYGVATATFTASSSTGTYSINASFAGDSNYAASSDAGFMNAYKYPSITTAADVVVSFGEVFIASATLKSALSSVPLAGTTVLFEYYAGTTTYTFSSLTDGFGVARATFTALGFTGSSSFLAVFSGGPVYAESSGIGSVMIVSEGAQTFLVIENIKAGVNEVFKATATLSSKGWPLVDKTIVFTFNGLSKSGVTGKNGVVVTDFNAPLSTGIYNYSAYFAGDENYSVALSTAVVEVIQTLFLNDPCQLTLDFAEKTVSKLKWTEVISNREKIKGYVIEKTQSLNKEWEKLGFVYSTSAVLSYDCFTEINNSVFYRVKSVSWDGQSSGGLVIVNVPEGDNKDVEDTSHIYMSEDHNAYAKLSSKLANEVYSSVLSTSPLRVVITKEENSDFILSYDVAIADEINNKIKDFEFRGNRQGIMIKISYNNYASGGISLVQPVNNSQMALFWDNSVEWIKLGGSNDIINKECFVFSKKLGKYGIKLAPLADKFTLNKVVPRIFTPEEDSAVINKARFYFENPENDEVCIRIFDLTGAIVRRNLEREGENIIFWDGYDMSGNIVRGGIYIYQIEAGSKIFNGTIIIAK